MAREITGVAELQPNGRLLTHMLYVFPIVPRVVDAGGVEDNSAFQVAGIPPRFKSQLSAAQLAAIAAGDTGFLVTDLIRSGGEANAAFLARVRADYDVLTAFEVQQARDRAIEANSFDRLRFQVAR